MQEGHGASRSDYGVAGYAFRCLCLPGMSAGAGPQMGGEFGCDCNGTCG